jgi:glycerol transport system substrate-binding protein
MKVKMKKSMLLGVALTIIFALAAGPAMADMAAAKKWVDEEFQPSTLSKQEQLKEMEWFIQAATPFKGMHIKVVSETIPTHEYESKTLAKAFEEITGIKVSHDLIQEGDVIEKLQTQWASGQNIYDAWINDSDLIGTHARYGYVVPLSDFMAGEGKDVTLPTLDVDDFMGKSFTTGTGREALPAAGSTVRQFILVPLRLVQASGLPKAVQGDLRLRTGRSGQLVGV